MPPLPTDRAPDPAPAALPEAASGRARVLRRDFRIALLLWGPLALVACNSLAWSAARAGEALTWALFAPTLVDSTLMLLLTPAIFAAARRWPLAGRRRRHRHLLLHLAGFGVLSIPVSLTMSLYWTLEARPQVAEFALMMLSGMTYWYLLSAGLGTALVLRAETREEKHRSRVLADQLVRLQLEDLHARLRPGFFFDTLDAIERLIPRDADAADRVVARLGVFLRYSLDAADTPEAALGDELAAVRAYLDVRAIPSRGRLRVCVRAEPETMETPVPPLLLLPLLGEVFRRELPDGARVEVDARVAEDAVEITLEVHGPGTRALEDDGPALRQVRDRLAHRYGPGAGAVLGALPRGGQAVALRIPTGPLPAMADEPLALASTA